ncbi:MAG: hypothetical protein Kow00127_08680 [Bacteroidales bacterium]
MKNIAKTFGFLLILLIAGSCQKEVIDSPRQPEQNPQYKDGIVYCGTPLTVDLVNFEQTIQAGTVTVGNDYDNFYVTYSLTGNYTIKNLWLYAGPADQVPGNLNPDGSGSFSPWYFPYKTYYPNTPTEHTFVIPKTDLPQDCFVVVSYGVLQGPDGQVIVFGKNNLKYSGYWFEYCMQNCGQPLGGFETMWAWGDAYSMCFINIPNMQGNKWGWTNGPLNEGQYTFELWAGAGQCNLNNGTHVGYLDINYTNGQATVTYNIFNGYMMKSSHLWVGNDLLPKKKNKYTAAPGKFPYKHNHNGGVTTYTYQANGLSGQIYVAAHGVVGDDE